MNTATATEKGGVEYPVTLEGAGRVRVDVAARTSSLIIPGSLSLGVRESATSAVQTIHSELQVRNKGTASKTFAITAGFRTPTEDDGSLTLLHPATVTVGKGRTRTISFDVRVDFRLLPPSDFLEYDGFLTLRETTAGGDVLRVPFHVIPIARSSASASSGEEDSQLTLQNRGLADTIVDVYQLGVRNPRKDLIPQVEGVPKDPSDWFNIRATGAHAFDFPPFGRVLEFAIATWGLRSVANMMVTEVWIDADQDGIPDYVVVVGDLGVLTTGAFDPAGTMVSAVFELKSGRGFLEFIVANPRNTAVQTGPILLDDLNFLGQRFGAPQINATNPTFSYFVDTTDLETGAIDVTRSATFNAIQPELDTSPNFLLLPAGTSMRIDVLGDEGSLLVLFYGNVAGPAQSQILLVGGHGDHGGHGD
jgi:hypothetical protein